MFQLEENKSVTEAFSTVREELAGLWEYVGYGEEHSCCLKADKSCKQLTKIPLRRRENTTIRKKTTSREAYWSAF